MAADLYAALQGFFGRYTDLAERPFFITGESYAGKYIPSIGAPFSLPDALSELTSPTRSCHLHCHLEVSECCKC